MRGYALVAVIALAAACGGPGYQPPKPLSRHFDESYIAGVSPNEMQEVSRTETEWRTAQREKSKAQFDLNESALLLEVAKNEREATRLDEKSAASRRRAAEKTADRNRINEATREVRGSEFARKAADQRVAYLNAYRGWLVQVVRYADDNQFWREAQFELAKAKIARSKNIQPSGFSYEAHVRQEQDRAKRASRARALAEKSRSAAMAARTKWLALQQETDKNLGRASQFPDPMAAKPAVATDPSRGSGGFTVGGAATKSDNLIPPADDPAMRKAPTPPPAQPPAAPAPAPSPAPPSPPQGE